MNKDDQIEKLEARIADLERELVAVYTNLLDAAEMSDPAAKHSKILSVAASAIVTKNNPLG